MEGKTMMTPRKQQQGAALIVGLVLLTVLTVLGVSGMNTATLEVAMTTNMQSQEDAFQSAETGIDIAVANRTFTTLAPGIIPVTPLGDGSYSTQAVSTWMENTPVPDMAFSMGEDAGTVEAFHFDVVAIGVGPRNAISTNNQSFYVVGPGGF